MSDNRNTVRRTDNEMSKRQDSKRTPRSREQAVTLRITRKQYAANGGRF